MWLMTKFGFYSIIRKESGTYHVRSREMHDIENLIRQVPLPDVQIVDTTGSDYAARIVVGRNELLTILNFLGMNIDYNSFSDAIEKTPDQVHKPYDRIGNILSCSLGAYGRRGSCTGEGSGSF